MLFVAVGESGWPCPGLSPSHSTWTQLVILSVLQGMAANQELPLCPVQLYCQKYLALAGPEKVTKFCTNHRNEFSLKS